MKADSKSMNYNVTFSPSSQEKNGTNQVAIIGYLNERIKYLEIENAELRKEISLKTPEKDKVEYYLRLRKELLEEIERVKTESYGQALNLSTEIDKLKEENATLTTKLMEKTNIFGGINQNFMKSNEDDLFSTQRDTKPNNFDTRFSNQFASPDKSKTLKYFSNLFDKERETENMMLTNMSDDLGVEKKASTNGVVLDTKENTLYLQSTVPFTVTNNNNPLDYERANINNFNNNYNTHNNPFIPIINDLEERVQILENLVREKEIEIASLNDIKKTESNEFNMEIDILQKEIETLKQKYVIAITNKKTLSQDFNELYDKQTENLRKNNDRSVFELEKKILHLEKLNNKYEADIEKLVKMNTESETKKQFELETVKNNLMIMIDNYEALYKAYEENLKTLIKQIDSIKQLYLARESEFINITNYYTETINDYSKPLTEMNNLNTFRTLEDNFIRQSKEIEDLKKKLDSFIKENSHLRHENLDAKPKLRQWIAESMNFYETNLNSITENHSSIITKLENINKFMEFFETKFGFFANLIEDNRKMKEKIESLECQMTQYDVEGKSLELQQLKESNFKLQKDLDIKNSSVKEYEDLVANNSKSTNNQFANTTGAPGGIGMNTQKKKNTFVSEDVVLKLKNEIAILSNQITSLTKTKEGLEKFYQVELKKCFEKITDKNEKIEELKSIVRKMENDYAGKKETVFNLWMLEFKEFKDNLFSISDVKSLIDKFKIDGTELTLHKEKVLCEEVLILRDEIKIKDDLNSTAKKNFEKEKKNLLEIIESYKKSIDSKILNYDNLIKEKQLEIESLKKEKTRLEGIENAKRNVNCFFNYIAY